MQLPLKLSLDMMQTKWKSILDPLIANILNSENILKDVKLSVGDNVINHLLGRKMQGWEILDIDGASVIYRSAPLNATTLTLNSSAAVTVSLGVF